MFGIRGPSQTRYFRLVYNKRICEWTLRWFKDEWEEEMIKGVSLSGGKVRVVHDQRAAPLSPKIRKEIPTALEITTLEKTYILCTTKFDFKQDRVDPDDGGRLLHRIVSICECGVDVPEVKIRTDVVRRLFEEALCRNNIKKIVRDSMRSRLNKVGMWDYIVSSTVQEKEVKEDANRWVETVKKWRDETSKIFSIAEEDEKKDHRIAAAVKWDRYVEEAHILLKHLKTMPKGLGLWLEHFSRHKGVCYILELLSKVR